MASGRGGGEWEAILVAAAAYMARMERLYAVNSAVAADDGNDGGRGREGKAGAPGGNNIARVNGQAAATAAAVCVYVFLASGYEWVTVMHEIPISSAQSMTSYSHTLGLSSTTPLVPPCVGCYT